MHRVAIKYLGSLPPCAEVLHTQNRFTIKSISYLLGRTIRFAPCAKPEFPVIKLFLFMDAEIRTERTQGTNPYPHDHEARDQVSILNQF